MYNPCISWISFNQKGKFKCVLLLFLLREWYSLLCVTHRGRRKIIRHTSITNQNGYIHENEYHTRNKCLIIYCVNPIVLKYTFLCYLFNIIFVLCTQTTFKFICSHRTFCVC